MQFDELDDDEFTADDEYLAAARAPLVEYESCRVCGCTTDDACIAEDGTTCVWAAPGLCSFCARLAA